MPLASKIETYAALVRTRKACHECAGLINPAVCCGGVHDSLHVGPWTLWQGNLQADLVAVGQDWGDTRYYIENRGRDKPCNQTNDALRTLLRTLLQSIGREIPAPKTSDAGGGTVFFTNAILCLKNGGMQAKVMPEWFVNCSTRFLRPTIDLIAPRVVVTLGELAYRAVASAYGVSTIPFRKAVDCPEGFPVGDGIICVPVYHCGARVLNTHRRMEKQVRDWERVKRALEPRR